MTGAAEDIQIQVLQCSAQAGFGFEVGCIEFPAFHEDAFFFLVGDCFAGSYANPDAAAEAYGRELGGLNLNDGNVSFRKGDFVHLHHRLREDVSFATYTGEVFLEVVVIVETGGFSIVIGTDEQIAGFAGVRPAREGRGVVPHRGTPEGLIPGARKTMEAANGINYAACSLQGFMTGLNC